MSTNLEKVLVTPDIPIRQAFEQIDAGGQHILCVTDENKKLLGTVTDGDLRRSILRSVDLDTSVSQIMNSAPISVDTDTSSQDCLALMRTRLIQQLPIVNQNGQIVDLVTFQGLLGQTNEQRPNWVVIMAGGLGSRLRPLTNETPKPLLSVGGRPILETIIIQLRQHGFKNIYIAVNYKADQVSEYFGDGSRWGVNICYLRESKPMGTAGALGLIEDRPTAPLLVMNGDLLTKLDFSSLFIYHAENKADITVCVREFDMEVPYGVVEFSENKIRNIIEKPVHSFMVNAGIYVVESGILDGIRFGGPYDMPALLQETKMRNDRVFGYPIHEYWIDIGRLQDLDRAGDEFSSVFR